MHLRGAAQPRWPPPYVPTAAASANHPEGSFVGLTRSHFSSKMFTCTINVIHASVCHLALVSQQHANANHVFGDSSKRHKPVFGHSWTSGKKVITVIVTG